MFACIKQIEEKSIILFKKYICEKCKLAIKLISSYKLMHLLFLLNFFFLYNR